MFHERPKEKGPKKSSEKRMENCFSIFDPVAAGLGILAMLGTGGARVDLWAHLLGFACGAAIGLVYTAVPRPVPGPAAQRQLMALALAIVAGCWVLAFH